MLCQLRHEITHKRHAFSLIFILLITLCLNTSCENNDLPVTDTPIITTTIQPLASITKQLAADDFQVICLIPPGTSPHQYTPTANLLPKIKSSHLAIKVGLGFDTFLDKNLNPNTKVLNLATIAGITPANPSTHNHDHAHDHSHTGPDPHLWLDITIIQKLIPKLAAQLIILKPNLKDTINQRANKLLIQLTQLDQSFTQKLAALPNKNIITFHDAWTRLASRYQLNIVATLTPPNAATGTMSPNQIIKARNAIKKYNIKTIFTEPQFPQDAANVLIEKTNIQLLTLDPLGDPNNLNTATYQDMMTYNINTIIKGLTKK